MRDRLDAIAMAKLLVRVKPRFPSLQTLGLAVQHFPHFIGSDFPAHAVDVVLLSFIVRGRGTHVIDQDRYAERGASLAVTHHGQRHKIVTSPRGMEIINVYLDLDHHILPVLPPALQRVLPLLLPLHPHFVNRLNRIVRLQFDDPKPPGAASVGHRRRAVRAPAGYQEAAMLHWKLFLMQCCRQATRAAGSWLRLTRRWALKKCASTSTGLLPSITRWRRWPAGPV